MIIYKIPEGYYKSLLHGYTYKTKDKKGRIKTVQRAGLGSKEKVIEYLNCTEGLLGAIADIRTE